jgi:hypothetical protein
MSNGKKWGSPGKKKVMFTLDDKTEEKQQAP